MCRLVAQVDAAPKTAKKFEVCDDFFDAKSPKIMIRHVVEMCLDLVGKIRRELRGDGVAEPVALDFDLGDKSLLVLQILRGGVKEMPDERLLPIRPGVRGPLPVGEGE